MGQEWSEATANVDSSSSSFTSNYSSSASLSNSHNNTNSSSNRSMTNTNAYYDEPVSNSYQGGFNQAELKSQTNDFFARKQAENSSRPEYGHI